MKRFQALFGSPLVWTALWVAFLVAGGQRSPLAQTVEAGLTRVATVPGGGGGAAMAVDDGVLLVAQGTTLRVFDVSVPENSTVVGSFNLSQPILGLTIEGDSAFVATSHDGLLRLDLSDPDSIVVSGRMPTRGQAVGVARSGDAIYVADNSLGFDVVASDAELVRVGEYLGEGFPRGIAASGALVLVADQPAGLVVVDVSERETPVVVGTLSLGNDPIQRVFVPPLESVADSFAQRIVSIVSLRQGLQLVSAVDPGSPTILSAIPTPEYPRAVAMWAASVFVASGELLEVWNISDPGVPVRVTTHDLGAVATQITVNASLVFVATTNEVMIFQRSAR